MPCTEEDDGVNVKIEDDDDDGFVVVVAEI